MSLSDYYQRAGIPKPVPRKKAKARQRASDVDMVHRLRMYVMGRERGICRCCMFRAAESMHELRPRSIGGKYSRRNSIGVCGDGVRGCHGMLQRHEIAWSDDGRGAEGALLFVPKSEGAAEWMRLPIRQGIESRPGSQRETSE